MTKPKILIVDDETDLTDFLGMRLESAGFDTTTASNGKTALEKVEKNPPDLIVLDIMMPEMDGYEVVERLHKDAKTSLIPVIMLTAKSSTEDKVKSLKMGIDDYMTKPFDANELLARVEAVLRRTKIGVPGAPISAEDKKRIDFLKNMVADKVEELTPEYNIASLNGYSYLYAAKFFGTKDGSEINQLKAIAEIGGFIAKFADKIIVCPYCFNHDINIRETCPKDHSPNINVVEMIHHFRCGYVGAADEFRDGIRYVCPKCRVELRQVGIDYDKPGESYICAESGEKFSEPDAYCQCRKCKKSFEADNALRQTIDSYVLTERGREAAETGYFTPVNLEQALVDTEVGLYNLAYFKKKLSDEMVRARELGKPFSLALVSVLDFDRMVLELGANEAKDILKDVASVLKNNLWKVDTPARYDKNDFITLLPETDRKKATVLASLVSKKIKELKKENLNVRIATASYPEDSSTEDGLIDSLLKK